MKVKAFTLVELLVVIAIISILAAMLLPTLDKALTQSKLIQCQGNLHQVYLTYSQYGSDYLDCLPPTPSTWVYGTNNMYGYDVCALRRRLTCMGLAASYIGSDNSIFYCPSRKETSGYVVSTNRSAWKAQYAAGFPGTYGDYITSHYSAGWFYSPDWLQISTSGGAGAANAASYYNATTPSTFKSGRPTIEAYAKFRRVMFVDTNETFDEPYTGNFHNNAEFQNFVRVDGSVGTIHYYWNSDVYRNGTYYAQTRIAHTPRWWTIFGNK